MPHELLTLAAARSGHFRFESGHHGDLWLDLDRLFSQPSELRPFVLALAHRLKLRKVNLVCGPLDGGALLAKMIATDLGCEFSFTQRQSEANAVEYRLPATLQDSMRGKRVALVDDAINSGSAIRATYDEVKRFGATVIVIGALVTLGRSAADFCKSVGVPLVSLAAVSSQLWTPAECPLCAKKVALDTTP